MINEFRTSLLCNGCNGIATPHKFEGKPKVTWGLVRCTSDICMPRLTKKGLTMQPPFMNRDVNACKNMISIVLGLEMGIKRVNFLRSTKSLITAYGGRRFALAEEDLLGRVYSTYEACERVD